MGSGASSAVSPHPPCEEKLPEKTEREERNGRKSVYQYPINLKYFNTVSSSENVTVETTGRNGRRQSNMSQSPNVCEGLVKQVYQTCKLLNFSLDTAKELSKEGDVRSRFFQLVRQEIQKVLAGAETMKKLETALDTKQESDVAPHSWLVRRDLFNKMQNNTTNFSMLVAMSCILKFIEKPHMMFGSDQLSLTQSGDSGDSGDSHTEESSLVSSVYVSSQVLERQATQDSVAKEPISSCKFVQGIYEGISEPQPRTKLFAELSQKSWFRTLLHIFSQLPVAISVVSASSAREGFPIVFVNKEYESMSGYREKDVLGKPYDVLHGPKTSEVSKQGVRMGLTQQRTVIIEKSYSYKQNQQPFHEYLLLKPIFDQRGRYRYVVFVHVNRSSTNFVKERLMLAGELYYFIPGKICEF